MHHSVVDKVTPWWLLSEIFLNMGQFPPRGSSGELGWDVSRQFRKRRQATEWKDAKGKRVSPAAPVPGRLGGIDETRQLPFRPVPQTGCPPRKQEATMAVGHAILVIAYHLLKRKEKYIELGVNYFDQKNAEALKRSLVRRLERLGHSVTLTPVAQPA
jgi:hypothetical protein